jgi:ABC-type multidrug transport system permease subunit
VRRAALVLQKDLRVLVRSPLLLGVLIAYPLLVAGLVGLVAGYGSSKPRVAFVDEDHLPRIVSVGGHRFRIQDAIEEVGKNVHLVRMDPVAARRALATGRVVATLTVPPGFLADLKSGLHAPSLVYQVTKGGISSRVTQQVQALVYGLNRQLQTAYVQTDLHYVQLIVNGGSAVFAGKRYDVLGLARMQGLLKELPPGPQRDRIAEFARIASIALAQTGNLLGATANPIGLQRAQEDSRSSLLSAQVQSYALALTITFLALLLAAGAIASERDENAIGRLRRGLISMSELVSAKVVLAAVVALALGLTIALVFGVIVEAGGVAGGEPWQRLPLLAVGLLVAGAALGALGTLLGALAGETRTASLVAVLVVMPIVFLGLVPREVVPVAGWLSDGLPFAHAVRYFSAALYDASPWGEVVRELIWLAGLGVLFGTLARLATRRLLA